jgi:hypothetical protein
MNRRDFLLGTVSTAVLGAALPASAAPRWLPRGTSSGAAPSSDIVTAVVTNPASSALVAPHVQFYQGFKRGDLVDGQILSIVDDLGGSVSYTARRRANWPDQPTNRSGADLACKASFTLPAKLSITSLTISGTTATCTTSSAHGLTSGDKVVVQPQNSDTTVGHPNDYYCGLVVVVVTGASTFTYTVIGITPGGSSTVGMEICYTRTLILRRTTGSWDDTLPAGKTTTDVFTDLQANFDNETHEFPDLINSSGATVGSGTYQGNLFQTLVPTGTDQLRILATGKTCVDICGIMNLADIVGGARHPTVSTWFYKTIMLNPNTGAVAEVQGRTWLDQSPMNVAMDYYSFRSRMKLGTTVVRSRGLSNNAAIDGKLQTFAPAAVNTSTGIINLPGHGFMGGERVRFTTTGTLPAGLLAATDYPVVWVDASNIKIEAITGFEFSEHDQYGTATAIIPTTQGTGTHTIACYQQSPHATRQACSGHDGKLDRWTGKTGALSPIGYHVIHDTNYLQQAGHIHRIDLTINLVNPICQRPPVAFGANDAANNGYLKSYYALGVPGIVTYAQDNTGGGGYHEYGAPFTDMGCKRARYPWELGHAQTLRASTLGICAYNSVFTHDLTNRRPPCVNNGPTRTGTAYAGMSAPDPMVFWNDTSLLNCTTPVSFQRSPGIRRAWSDDHRYSLFHQLYLFEGGGDIHDLTIMDPMQMMLSRNPTTYSGPGDGVSSRKRVIGGVTYYSMIPFGSSRSDVWGFNTLAYGLLLCAASAPEYPVLKDYFDDTLKSIKQLLLVEAAANDPNWLTFGGWNVGNTMILGPGVRAIGNQEWISIFFEGIMGTSVANAYSIYPSADFQAVIGHFAKFLDNLYRNMFNSAYGAVYIWRNKQGAALDSLNSGLSPASLDDALCFESNCYFIIYLPDGRIAGATGAANYPPFTPPITGEKQYLTLSEHEGNQDYFPSVPPEVTKSTTYYVRAQTGSWFGYKLATTNSDATIIPSYSTKSSSTISTNMGSGTTSITTTSTLTGFFSSGVWGPIVISSVAGVEIAQVEAGIGTNNLTITRGLYGTSALVHGANANVYVPHISGFCRDLQMRNVAFPPAAHGYRVPNAGANYPSFGYRTLSVAALGAMWKGGIIPRTAYDNVYAWFNDPIEDPTQSGPAAFGAINSLMHSFNPNL